MICFLTHSPKQNMVLDSNKDHFQCENYPEDYTFSDCDNRYVISKLVEFGYTGLTPLWVLPNAKDFRNHKTLPRTANYSRMYKTSYDDYPNLYMGFSENCTVPCTSTRIINRKHISETVPYSGFLDLRITHTYEKLIENNIFRQHNILYVHWIYNYS